MKDNFNSKARFGEVEALLGELKERMTRLPSAEDEAGARQESDLRLCPEPGAWIRLGSGETAATETSELLTHAARCAACATSLRLTVELLSAEPSPEEEAEAARLASTLPDWQHDLSVRLAQTPRQRERSGLAKVYLWAGSGLAATLALTAGLTVWWQQNHTPERLLAEAYTP